MNRRNWLCWTASSAAGLFIPAVAKPRAKVFDLGRDVDRYRQQYFERELLPLARRMILDPNVDLEKYIRSDFMARVESYFARAARGEIPYILTGTGCAPPPPDPNVDRLIALWAGGWTTRPSPMPSLRPPPRIPR
jgi:hypothetical protein